LAHTRRTTSSRLLRISSFTENHRRRNLIHGFPFGLRSSKLATRSATGASRICARNSRDQEFTAAWPHIWSLIMFSTWWLTFGGPWRQIICRPGLLIASTLFRLLCRLRVSGETLFSCLITNALLALAQLFLKATYAYLWLKQVFTVSLAKS